MVMAVLNLGSRLFSVAYARGVAHGLSASYQFDLKTHTADYPDVRNWIGQAARLDFIGSAQSQFFHGIIVALDIVKMAAGYQLHWRLMAPLSRLATQCHRHVFYRRKPTDMLSLILDAAGYSPSDYQFRRCREEVSQDLLINHFSHDGLFLNDLLHQLGWAYGYQQSEQQWQIQFVDDLTLFTQKMRLSYQPLQGMLTPTTVVFRLTEQCSAGDQEPGLVTAESLCHWLQPGHCLEVQRPTGELSVYRIQQITHVLQQAEQYRNCLQLLPLAANVTKARMRRRGHAGRLTAAVVVPGDAQSHPTYSVSLTESAKPDTVCDTFSANYPGLLGSADWGLHTPLTQSVTVGLLWIDTVPVQPLIVGQLAQAALPAATADLVVAGDHETGMSLSDQPRQAAIELQHQATRQQLLLYDQATENAIVLQTQQGGIHFFSAGDFAAQAGTDYAVVAPQQLSLQAMHAGSFTTQAGDLVQRSAADANLAAVDNIEWTSRGAMRWHATCQFNIEGPGDVTINSQTAGLTIQVLAGICQMTAATIRYTPTAAAQVRLSNAHAAITMSPHGLQLSGNKLQLVAPVIMVKGALANF